MKHFSTVLLKILFLLSCLVGQLAYADDFASISSQISQAGGIHTCTKGYGLLDGKISDVQPLIKGALPFALKYQASIRPDALSGVLYSLNQNEEGTADWTNNYSSYMTITPTGGATATYSFKLLGGDQNYIFFTNSAGVYNRLYTSGGSASIGPSFYSTDTRDVKVLDNGSSITVQKDGVIYVYGSVMTVGPSTTQLVRITNVVYPGGKTLTLTYDGDKTLTSVQDNRNNRLDFERTYSSGLLSSQTTLQKSLITAVKYTSGNDTQRATISYTNPSSSVYQLQQSVSPAYGTYTYQYANVFRPSLYSNAQKSNTSITPYAFSYFTLPTLASVTDAANNVQQKWDVSSNYVWDNSNKTFSTAQVTLTSYSPLDSVNNVGKTSTLYDDNLGKITMSTTVTTASGSSTVSQAIVTFGSMALPADPTSYSHTNLTLMDAADTVMTITGTYPCVTNGNGTPVQATTTNAFTSQVKQITDGNSNKSSFYYDSLSRLTSFVEAVGTTIQRTTTYAYGNLSNGAANPYSVPTVVTAPEVNITNTLNARGQISQQTKSYPQSGSSSQTFGYVYFEDSTKSNYGLVGTYVGPRTDVNDTTLYTYDSFGNLAWSSKTVSNANYATSYTNYNSAGQPQSVTNPDGSTDTMTYDGGYRLLQTIHSKGGASQTTSNTYNAIGQLTSSTDADGQTTTYAYDVLGRLTTTTSPNGNKKTTSYFLNNVVSSVLLTLPDGTIQESHWTDIDTSGRLIGVRTGGISSQMWTGWNYDANNNVIKTFTAGGINNTWTYDALNRVTSHTDGNGKVDTKAYDDANNNTSESASGGAGSARVFKNHDILASEHNSDYGNKDHYHDLGNNEYEQHHIDRVCNAGTIDQLGRPQQKNCYSNTYNDSSIQVNDAYTYDQSALGNLDKITANNSGYGVDTSYSYDLFHRVTSKTQVNHTPATWGYAASSQTVGYTYTSGGKISTITYPSGNTVNYWYKNDGMLDNVQLNNNYVIHGIGYDGANRLSGFNWGGTKALWQQQLNDAGQVLSILNTYADGTQNFSEKYDSPDSYDKDGRLQKKTLNQTNIFSYTYDNDSQLKTESFTNAPSGSTTWSLTYYYDDNGNRIGLRETGTPGLSYTQADYQYTANHLKLWTKNGGGAQPLVVTQQGELSTTYMGTAVYDSAGHRRGESGTNVGMYFDYNHKNERTFRGGTNLDRQYAYDEQSHLIGEYTPTGVMIVEYIYMGDRPIAAVYPGNRVVYITTDYQGKPRSGIDAVTGQQVWYWNPDAFGVTQPTGGASLANGVEINLRFPGQYYDVQSGLYYNHNRYYNPELGRYMEPDPTGLEAGLNPYAYTNNNPVNNTDSSGLDWMTPLANSEMGGTFYQNFNESYSSGSSCLANANYNNFTYIPGATGSYSSPIGERGLESTYPEFAVMGVVSAVRTGIGFAIDAFAGASTTETLSAAATRAASTVGTGSGPVYGTAVHTAFKQEVLGLGDSNLTPEVSYLNGKIVSYGTKGSVRPDVVEGPVEAPTALFDLKTGSATLPASKIQQILSHMPPGSKNIPVSVIRP